MARPIQATPTLYGEDAKRVIDQIINGTPNTPERIERFRRADELAKKFRYVFKSK